MVDNPHDAFFKLVFSQPEHAAGELRSVLPADLASRIAWDTLVLNPGSFVDDAFGQSHTDLLFGAKIDGRDALIYYLFEHLSTVVPHIALRLLRYEVRIWEDWLTKHPAARKLPPIVSVVLHHSESGWSGATAFGDLIDATDETFPLLAEFVPRFRFLLDDVSHATDGDLRQRAMMTALGKVALWCFRDVRKPGVLIRDLARWFDLLREVVKAPNGLAAIHAVLRYIAVTTKRLDKEEFRETVRRFAAPIEGMMDTLEDQLHEYFMEKGIERGIARGRRDALLRQLRKRFGEVPQSVETRVSEAGIPQLDAWTDRVLTARTLDEVLDGG